MLGYILALMLSFVTGDAFRSSADHVFEGLDPSAVQRGDSVFITNHQVEEFFRAIHPRIENPYVLISHVTDEDAPRSFGSYLEDPKILAWFAMNYDGYVHPKIHPIPIGLAPRKLPHGNLEAVQRVRERGLDKLHLLYMNITIQTYSSERWEVFKKFARCHFCFRTGKKPFEDYLTDIAQSKFVISPRGSGLDTYRLREALYVGSIPIVATSSLDGLYEGLPVLIVKDWDEVTEAFLERKYEEFSSRQFSLEKLDFSYWLKRFK
ncbi:MAG TPA: hypothetical protein VLF94_02170 [Chlamydiales bacterium]|nr:hypothetical protein [Chlamydiales bacterium]